MGGRELKSTKDPRESNSLLLGKTRGEFECPWGRGLPQLTTCPSQDGKQAQDTEINRRER
jgi:hypothetical protein